MLFIMLLIIGSAVIATAQTAALKNYYNKENKVGFKYPAKWKLEAGKTNDEGKRKSLVDLDPPAASIRGQLSEASASLSVWASDLEACKTFKDEDTTPAGLTREGGKRDKPVTRKVGNLTFYLIAEWEGAAGTVAADDYYHTFRDGRCYELSFSTSGHDASQPDRYQRAMDQNFKGILRSLYFGK
jgi:hypothetical protein